MNRKRRGHESEEQSAKHQAQQHPSARGSPFGDWRATDSSFKLGRVDDQDYVDVYGDESSDEEESSSSHACDWRIECAALRQTLGCARSRRPSRRSV